METSAAVELNDEAIQHATEQKSCFILATNADQDSPTPEQILHYYKAQSAVERGFRFLKDPLFFVSSLFIKKPSRIDALLMIMTLSLLVYSIAQRRMRASIYLDGFDKLREKIIHLIGGHSLHLYHIQKKWRGGLINAS